MNIIQLLPLLDGWMLDFKDYDTTIAVAASQEFILHEVKPPHFGWFSHGFVLIDQSTASLVLRYDKREADTTPAGLYVSGLLVPDNANVYLSRYDVGAGRYGMAYAPATPLPFRKKLAIAIRAPAASAVNIIGASTLVYKVINEQTFLESLRKVLGTEKAETMVPSLRTR